MDPDESILETSKDETAIEIPSDGKPPLKKHSSSLTEIVVDSPKKDKTENPMLTNNEVSADGVVKDVTIDLLTLENDAIEQENKSHEDIKTNPSESIAIAGDVSSNTSEMVPEPLAIATDSTKNTTEPPVEQDEFLPSPDTQSANNVDETVVSEDAEKIPKKKRSKVSFSENLIKEMPKKSTKNRPSSAQVSRTQEVLKRKKRPESAPGRNSKEKQSTEEIKSKFDRKKSLEKVREDSTSEINQTIKDSVVENNNTPSNNAEESGEMDNGMKVEDQIDVNNNESVEEESLQQKSVPPLKKEHSFQLPPLSTDEELPWALYQRIKTNDEDEEKTGDDEFSESESDGEKYSAEKNEDLPDMYEVLEGLDDEKLDLNSKTAPPNIFDTTDNELHKREVLDLKQGLAEEEIKIYLDEFEDRVRQEVLMIGNISLEDVQEEERRLRQEHITFQQQQAVVQRQRQQEIMQAMERAKKYVMNKYKEKYRELRMREQHLMQKDRSYKDEIHRAFRRSESQLRKALKKRKGEVKTMYGDLTFADGQYGGSKGRRWKIDWNRTPQPIQIKLKCLRGVKDKLPASRYVLMVSLYNRLGGNVMKWSNLKGQQWGGATLPIWHDGEFFNIEMKIDQSVFTVCPSKPDMRPGMVLVFELFILRGAVTPTDKVVGWGCFPICDADFNVIEGRYKTPLLRGDMDPFIDKFGVMEKLMANDLENWLCNFYFEIIRLPRYMAGQKEYEVELQFTSGILGAPDRTKTSEENIDGENAIFGSKSDLGSSAIFSHSSRSNSVVSAGNENDISDSSSVKKPSMNVLIVDNNNGEGSSSGRSSSRGKHSITESQVKLFRAENLSADLRKRKQTLPKDMNDETTRPMTSVAASRALVEEKGLTLSDDETDSDYSDQDVYAVKKDEGFKPVKGHPGMFYKIHHNTPSDVYARKMFTLMPKTPLIAKEKTRKKLTHLEQLDTHSYSVKTTWSNKGRIEHKGTKKFQYIGRMMLSELGISQIKSREFWAMILMLLITYWMRLYLHYIGQWVALLGFLVPLNKFEFLPYTVVLNYQNTLLRTREEIALIVIGPFTNIMLLLVMLMISGFIQFLFERFPNIFSRFLMAFGLHCILDPIWILITDSALKRYENRGGEYPIGDAFKLYWHFDRFYNNDNVTLFVSIALTTFLYFMTIFCACVIIYIYFLRLHNNGRLMDVYWRLHGKDDSFFTPYDLELSLEELTYICRKAENWRGEEGERRKTAVYDYIWEEEQIEESNWDDLVARSTNKAAVKEVTTHVSIHTLHLDGLRELYRHFLRLPDGAIVEVFGEMNIPGIDEGVKQALIKRTNFQPPHPSQDNLRKRSSRASSASRRPSRASSASSAGGREYYEVDHEGTTDRLVVPGSSHA